MALCILANSVDHKFQSIVRACRWLPSTSDLYFYAGSTREQKCIVLFWGPYTYFEAADIFGSFGQCFSFFFLGPAFFHQSKQDNNCTENLPAFGSKRDIFCDLS